MPARLIDVSEHQGDVGWWRVRGGAGYPGAYVRVSDGDHRDRFYTSGRADALREAGLVWGPC
jgi:hypothetical protein